MTFLIFCAGLVLLIAGAELLVKGASRMAASLGISPLVIGLTVVAFGTSSPELAVSVKAVLAGQNGVSLGNIIGSNIFNVLFILGLSALVTPLVVSQQLVRLDVPLMILVSVIVWIMAADQMVGRGEGLALLLGLAAYLFILIRQSRRESGTINDEYAGDFGLVEDRTGHWFVNTGLVAGGLILLVLGSRWLVSSAVAIAQSLGVSDLVIGLTIIAAGTSLPEVVTSVVASLRGERDIAVGNIVGSNLFNLLGVLGLASLVAPAGLQIPAAVINFDLPVMIVVAFACLPIFFTGNRISRMEGALLLAYYVAYTLYLILASAHHDALPWLSGILLYFAIPLTIFTLLIIAVQEMVHHNKSRQE